MYNAIAKVKQKWGRDQGVALPQNQTNTTHQLLSSAREQQDRAPSGFPDVENDLSGSIKAAYEPVKTT